MISLPAGRHPAIWEEREERESVHNTLSKAVSLNWSSLAPFEIPGYSKGFITEKSQHETRWPAGRTDIPRKKTESEEGYG